MQKSKTKNKQHQLTMPNSYEISQSMSISPHSRSMPIQIDPSTTKHEKIIIQV